MKWLFKRPENGLIDGKSPATWEKLGVHRWMLRRDSGQYMHRFSGDDHPFSNTVQYAPATAEMMPAPWPELWQWRKLDADMDERTWEAASLWQYGGRNPTGPRYSGDFCDGSQSNVSAKGEWWAPADQYGNPCDWPEVEPQPVVVIPAAEMTPLVLYGHLAMGGKWQWQCTAQNGPWVEATANTIGCWHIGNRYGGEQWSPADEHGNFCELRRVVSDTSAEVERRRVDELDRELAEARQELSRYRGAARMAAELADEAIAWLREVDGDKA